MEEKAKIQKVYEEYFELIDSYFGGIKHHLDTHDKFPHIKLANRMASYDLIADLIIDATEDLGTSIDSFWKKHRTTVEEYLKKSTALKCTYSGDLSPLDLERFLKRSVLYIDTIILPDPILNISAHTRQVVFDKRYYLRMLIRHVFNVWRIKDLVLTDIEPRTIVIYPSTLFALMEGSRDDILRAADNSYLAYQRLLFGKEFKDRDELKTFYSQHPDAQDIYQNIVDPALLPLKFRVRQNFLQEFRDGFGELRKKLVPDGRVSESEGFANYLDYQMKRAHEQSFFCNEFTAEPVADYEVAWSFNNYVIGGPGIDSAILNSLQRSPFDWIGNVPITALSKLRQAGELAYIRQALRTGIHDIHTKGDVDLEGTIKQIQANLEQVFAQQKGEQKRLENEVKKIATVDIPIATGVNLVGFIPVIGNVVGFLSSTFETTKNYMSAAVGLEKVRGSPINLLIDAYEKT